MEEYLDTEIWIGSAQRGDLTDLEMEYLLAWTERSRLVFLVILGLGPTLTLDMSDCVMDRFLLNIEIAFVGVEFLGSISKRIDPNKRTKPK